MSENLHFDLFVQYRWQVNKKWYTSIINKGGTQMINRLIKIRSDTNEVVSSSFCFFNEEDLEKMDITLDKPIIQNDITYTYQLIKGE